MIFPNLSMICFFMTACATTFYKGKGDFTQIAAQGLSDGAWNGTFNFTITQQTTTSKMYPIRPMRSAQPNR